MTDKQLRLEQSAPVKASTVVEKPKPLTQPKRIIVFDNYKEIGRVMTGDKRSLQVSIGIRDGITMIALRDFFFSTKRDTWIPSYHGLTIPIRIPIKKGTEIATPYNSLVAMMNEAVEISKGMPISDPANTIYAK